VTALLTLALGCASCGRSAPSTPLAVSAPRRLCLPRDLALRPVKDTSPTLVLVPGHPTGVLLCRYTSTQAAGLQGVSAGALSVVRPDVIDRLTSEFDALRPLSRGRSCPAFGGRSELFVFRYGGGSTARVLLRMEGCIPVTNGRVVRDGLGLHLAGGEVHWPDEGLL
jgi:hypothetical protein